MNREPARAVVQQVGVAVSEAQDGKACLRRLNQATFDAVLLDLRMPGMSGGEVLGRIRKNDHAILPVLAFTADDELDRLDDEGGFDGLVRKPMNALALLTALAAALSAPSKAGPPS